MSGVASCSSCGAPVPVVVLVASRCGHCGGQAYLPPQIQARLEALRTQIARGSRKEQQLDGALASFGEGVGFLEIGMAAILWGFIGGLLTLGAAGNLPEHQSFLGVLWSPPLDDEPYSFAAATFWMAFVTVLGFAVCCFFAAVARLFARRQVRFAFPAPPAFPGGPPGCRVCGGDLGKSGVVRRCPYCQADNVVDGVHFSQVTSDLSARLQARERAVNETLARRQRIVAGLEKLVLGPPFAIILLAPLVFWLGRPQAAWWILPLLTFALAGALFVGAALLPNPRARGR